MRSNILEIELFRFNKTVIGTVNKQLRRGNNFNNGSKEFRASNGIVLSSVHRPMISSTGNTIYLRGSIRDADDNALKFEFRSDHEADDFCRRAIEAVKEYNDYHSGRSCTEKKLLCQRYSTGG